VATLLRVAREVNPGFSRRHNFQTPEATTARLEASGFADIEAWLSDAPTRFDPGAPFEAFLETVCLRTFLDELSPAEREPFVRAVAARMPEPVLDYVRLNIVARRAG
jgi:trans-aconitate 2-methyltransferase